MNEIIIQRGFSNEHASSAAELYDSAFGEELSIAIPNPISRKSVLKYGLNPNYSFVAFYEGEMVGIAGFHTDQGSLTDGITPHLLREQLGCMGAVRAFSALALFHRPQTGEQLLMDGIGVSPQIRGSGIGTKLLHRLIEYAREKGTGFVRLDVIDTNPAAKRLYERVGFSTVKTVNCSYLKWLFGFKAANQMEFNLDAE